MRARRIHLFPPNRPVEGTVYVRPADQVAGCPTYGCPHLAEAHEAGEYADDGTPVRAICTVDGCPCGQRWRDTEPT